MSAAPHLDLLRRDRVRTVKIVVTGPCPPATSTFVRTIAEVAILSSEGPDDVATPTVPGVAMDFGRVSLGPDLALYLFGTVGDDVEAALELVADGLLGVVAVVEAAAGRTVDGQLARTVASVDGVPVVVAVHAVADPGDEDLLVATVRDREGLSDDVPMMVADVRDREDVKRVLLRLLEVVRTCLHGATSVPRGEVAR